MVVNSYKGGASIGFGVTEIILGTFCGIFEITARAYGNRLSVSMAGLWIGILFIINGVLGIRAGLRKTTRLIQWYRGMSIFMLIISLGLMGYGVTAGVIEMGTAALGDMPYKTRMASGMSIGIAVCAGLEFVVNTLALAFACQALLDDDIERAIYGVDWNPQWTMEEPRRPDRFAPISHATYQPRSQTIEVETPQFDQPDRSFTIPSAPQHSTAPPSYSEIGNYPRGRTLENERHQLDRSQPDPVARRYSTPPPSYSQIGTLPTVMPVRDEPIPENHMVDRQRMRPTAPSSTYSRGTTSRLGYL